MSKLRAVKIGWPEADIREDATGVQYVTNKESLADYPRALFDRFDEWAELQPDRIALADRKNNNGWRTRSYAEIRDQSLAIGECLLANGCTPERGLAILAPNSVDHALLALGAMRAGIPYGPITPAYALMSTNYDKLAYVMSLMNPAMVYVDEMTPFSEALDASVPKDCKRLSGNGDSDGLLFADALATQPGSAIEAASASVNGDTVVKLLFTSGSTGMPKAVINTQRMMSSNQEMIRAGYAYIQNEPPVMVDWLPWNHTAGGNHNFGLCLYNGGSLYIDEGKPTPRLIDNTVRNITDVSPSIYFNVPKGYEMLVDAMEDNVDLRNSFFRRLKLIQYAGAGLSDHVLKRLREMAVETVGEEVTIVTGYGATETAPFATMPVSPMKIAGAIGLPAPGLELKLVPNGEKTELRLRGPSITPGYWGEPDKTASAFDEEGFYCIQDAVRWLDPDDTAQGLMFDGRLAEDFKLSSGTWVNFGKLRSGLIAACAPIVRDVVLTGHDKDFLGALLFLDVEQARRLNESLSALNEAELAEHPLVQEHVQMAIDQLAAQGTGSSNRIRRVMIMSEAASLQTGEMTDKGSINQGAVLRRRADLVDGIYAEESGDNILEAASL